MKGDKKPYESRSRISTLKLNSLLEITKAINGNAATRELLATFEDTLRNKLNIGKLALFNFNDKWECILTYGLEDEHENIDVQRDLLQYKEISIVDSESDNHHSFEIIIPVYHKDQPLAFVLIGDLDDDKVELSPVIKHLPFVQTLTNIIVVAIENKRLFKENIKQIAIRRELELASQMQHMLFPELLPKNEHIDFDARYLPHQEVGGDYYDFIWVNKNEFVFCMADVSGKGLAAALLMSNFQANLRVLINHTNSLTELVRELNNKVMLSAKGEKFITFFIGKYNIQTRTLSYINAGHNPPLLINKNSVSLLRIGCTGLGMFDELITVKEGMVPVKPGSLLFCYTDGVVETENDQEEYFGMHRLSASLKRNQDISPKEINESLLMEVIGFKKDKPYSDDIAIFSGKMF
ncbi:MAG: rsbU 3 [Bacteroidetes bacterium]|nr:rsbU 3 [Bacteroidota bacterium]